MTKKDINGQASAGEADVAQQPDAPAEAALPEDPETAPDDAPATTAEKIQVEDAASPAQDALPNEDVAAALRLELRQTKDQLLRQAAELQNYRRRMEKEHAESLRRGQVQVLEPMLNVLDDFRRSLEASAQVEQQEPPGPAYQALREGVQLVYQNFSDALKKLGVEAIEAVGKPFDEHEHEALMQLPAPEGTTPGVVLEEIQRGYRLGERVLRHARVVVAG